MGRRKQYFIDRKFQKRFLIMFGVVVFFIAVLNFWFYYFKLLPSLDNLLFKSHFRFDNLILYFRKRFEFFFIFSSLFLISLIILVYSYFRLKIEKFFKRFESIICKLIEMKEPIDKIDSQLPEEFEDIPYAMEDLIKEILRNREKQKKILGHIQKFFQ
ncbi:hypothetical protein TTHT_1307 [Thermotomaculum hydrothermale]|uniref:Uncharacterized protein n=1 Tax=Thermotomaculum hydrothermale TaxID=981385 RepID=A0A7R6PFK8_9BACT|nr:hypothetical protein [Thermotomaculum hydrothermale]BBB32824.1 hypothetical protein TTHT_1307 [Thermotomaculum hydrothermale]